MEITTKNFEEQLTNITQDLKKCCFVAFDAEFSALLSGDPFKYRLFDTNEERYDKLKTEVSNIIMTQVGLTMFRYDRDQEIYVATVYTFHLCPQVFGNVNQSLLFQASTLRFLCRHKFDFNKFIYEGIPYLSKAEEAKLRQHLRDKTLVQWLNCSLEITEEKQLQQHCSEVSKWLTLSKDDTLYLDVESPVLRFLVHNEIRMRFRSVLTTDSLGNSKKILVYRNINVEGATSALMTILEENLINNLLGFTQIINLLQASQKPIVGHNVFLDTVLLHNQFIGPLPNKYSVFKKNMNNMFPRIYDTKYISSEMYRKLNYNEIWLSNALQDLYEFFVEGKCKKLKNGVNRIILSQPVNQSYHEAGWDSYCSGYCFIRLGHWLACENSGKYHSVVPTETLSALSPFTNKINIIRSAIPYMNLVGKDPPSHRPGLLHVMAIAERTINIEKLKNVHCSIYRHNSRLWTDTKNFSRKGPNSTLNELEIKQKVITSVMACVFASFGSLDIKPYGRRTALIAATSKANADKILKQFRNSNEYKVSRYNVYKHSITSRLAIWSGTLLTGSLVLYFLHKKVKVLI